MAKLVPLVVASLLVSGCGLAVEGWRYISTPPKPYPIEWFQVDPVGKRGLPVHVLARLGFSMGCTRETRVLAQVDDAARLVRLYASDRQFGEICTAAVVEEFHSTTFIPAQAGRYQVVADGVASAGVEVAE